MNSDGKPNNAATETVCNGEGAGVGTLMTDTWDYGSSTTYNTSFIYIFINYSLIHVYTSSFSCPIKEHIINVKS
jgi:hypothetical protein